MSCQKSMPKCAPIQDIPIYRNIKASLDRSIHRTQNKNWNKKNNHANDIHMANWYLLHIVGQGFGYIARHGKDASQWEKVTDVIEKGGNRPDGCPRHMWIGTSSLGFD